MPYQHHPDSVLSRLLASYLMYADVRNFDDVTGTTKRSPRPRRKLGSLPLWLTTMAEAMQRSSRSRNT